MAAQSKHEIRWKALAITLDWSREMSRQSLLGRWVDLTAALIPVYRSFDDVFRLHLLLSSHHRGGRVSLRMYGADDGQVKSLSRFPQ